MFYAEIHLPHRVGLSYYPDPSFLDEILVFWLRRKTNPSLNSALCVPDNTPDDLSVGGCR